MTNLVSEPEPRLADHSKRPAPIHATRRPHPAAITPSGLFSFLTTSVLAELKSPVHHEGDRRIPEIPYSLDLLTPLCTFRTNARAPLAWVNEKFGELASFRAPNNRQHFIVSDPEVVKQVLMLTDRGTDPLDKSGYLDRGAQFVIGDNSVLEVSNASWKAQRSVMASALARTAIEAPEQLAGLDDAIDRGITALRHRVNAAAGGILSTDLQRETTVLAMRVALDVLFHQHGVTDVELHQLCEDSRRIHQAFPFEAASPVRIPHKLLSWISSRSRSLLESRGRIVERLLGWLNEEIKHPSGKNDVVAVLARACTDPSSPMSKSMALHNLVGLFFASHESTGNVLSYISSQLLRDPTLMKRVRTETESTAGIQGPPRYSRENLPFVHQVIEEGLRMHPPVFLLLRHVTNDFEVMTTKGKVRFPKGAEILLNLYDAQRDDGTFGMARTGYSAAVFQPDRWAKENLVQHGLGSRDLDLFSFGLGSRICAGVHLFWAEAPRILMRLLDEFEITPTGRGFIEGRSADFTLQTLGGHPVMISNRRREGVRA